VPRRGNAGACRSRIRCQAATLLDEVPAVRDPVHMIQIGSDHQGEQEVSHAQVSVGRASAAQTLLDPGLSVRIGNLRSHLQERRRTKSS
jgi:hypothetical protein